MRPAGFAFAAACYAAAVPADAAGLQFIDVPAQGEAPALSGAVWSPCAAPPEEVSLGNVALSGVKDCPIVGRRLPLVVVSHGRGGGFGGHHDTAETLADAGFVVAAISHPGDNRQDLSRSGDLSVFVERPEDIKRLVNYMLDGWPDAGKIDPERIGFFGFSRGAYTGLVVIGGDPDFHAGPAVCRHEGPAGQLCRQFRDSNIPPGGLAHDPRIKAAVLADPIFGELFDTDGLVHVRIPIELWGSALGGDGVAPASVAALAKRLPPPTEYRVVANANHFGFLPPCSPALADKIPEVCTDPPGFDRAAFHQAFDAEVLAFFRAHLVAEATP